MSVLKLSTIWNMKKVRRTVEFSKAGRTDYLVQIRQYAIHMLSTGTLSPIEKIFLARAYRVSAWLKEAITTLTKSDHKPAFKDLVTLGWETAARILWIRQSSCHSFPNTLHFSRDAIKCGLCQSSSSLINSNYGCGHVGFADAELFFDRPYSMITGTAGRHCLVELRLIKCKTCRGNPFSSIDICCSSCSNYITGYHNAWVTPSKTLEEIIEEMFGEEIKLINALC